MKEQDQFADWQLPRATPEIVDEMMSKASSIIEFYFEHGVPRLGPTTIAKMKQDSLKMMPEDSNLEFVNGALFATLSILGILGCTPLPNPQTRLDLVMLSTTTLAHGALTYQEILSEGEHHQC